MLKLRNYLFSWYISLTFKLNQDSGLHFVAAKFSHDVFTEALQCKAPDLAQCFLEYGPQPVLNLGKAGFKVKDCRHLECRAHVLLKERKLLTLRIKPLTFGM